MGNWHREESNKLKEAQKAVITAYFLPTYRKNMLPIELSRYGDLRYLKQKSRNEWSAECPKCRDSGHSGRDDPDRLCLWGAENGRGARVWCRQCTFFEWADQGENWVKDPELVRKAEEERQKLARENAIRIQKRYEELAKATYWIRFHEEMGEEERQKWREQGLSDYLIDYYKLGYCHKHKYYHRGEMHESPSMTIPHYQGGWSLRNIQHRLTKPVENAGKYRQLYGLPPSVFMTEPEHDLSGTVLIAEGAKKAMVTYQNVGAKVCGKEIQIVGVPFKTPSDEMLSIFDNAELIYLMLDPDATQSGHDIRIAKKLGKDRVRIVHTPIKVDDMFIYHKLEKGMFDTYIKGAVKPLIV